MNERDINKIMMNSLTDDCLEMLEILNNNGFESFAVGGCVRDALLGNTPKDEDLTTNAKPEEVKAIFESMSGFSVWDSGIKHGTVTVVNGDTSIEITTYRSDGDYSDGRRPDSVQFEDSIDADLARRDFTINAMAWSPRDGFKDNYNGLQDLDAGVIRAVGLAEERMQEDALRMMRAVRFSAKYGFEIDEELTSAIVSNAENLSSVSHERIRDELSKTLMTDNPMYVKKFHDLGLMKEISPDIDNLFDCEQNNKYHIYNVGDHTIKTLEESPKDLNIRMALLLHDVGKPVVKFQNEKTGADQFIDHAEVSAMFANQILRDLKFSSKEVSEITDMVRYHDSLLAIQDNPVKIHNGVRDFILAHQDLDDKFYKSFIEIKKCDLHGQNTAEPLIADKFGILDKLENEFNSILKNPHTAKDLAINGRDIMSLEKEDKAGVIHHCKGKAVKEMKDLLLKHVIDNPEDNNEETLKDVATKNIIQAEINVGLSEKKQAKRDAEVEKFEQKIEIYRETLVKDDLDKTIVDTEVEL